jgi:predicted cupin superfamily sugar epimerase
MTAAELISTLELRPHPEGGHYREVYRADEQIAHDALPARFGGARAHATSIYFLLARGQTSGLHAIASDELWHHYDGGALRVVTLAPDGTRRDHVLGKAYDAGERPFAMVPRGAMFGAELVGAAAFALVGCTVAPGFDFADFVMPSRAELHARWPQHADVIARLGRG